MLPGAEQSRGAPGAQVPAAQWSPTVQKLPSSHGVVSGFGAGTQASALSSQTPVLQTLPAAEQSRGAPGAQVPAAQWSPTVQKLPSSHGVVSGFGAATQA